MNKTYFKNILKDIKNTKGKVISIATMVGLAALVVVALTLTGPTMRKTLNNSLKTYNHPDLILKSTYGLDYEDEMIIKKDKDIDKLSLVKTADLLDDENLIRVKSYNETIPKSVIINGRKPKKKNEIILDRILKDKYKIGDKIKFSYVDNPKFDEEVMDNLEYEVVGFFRTSDYFMEDMRELSFSAKKELNGYAYALDENFDTDKYGEANIIYKNTKNLDKSSYDYQSFVDNKKENLENAIANRPEEVLKKIKSDANDDLDDAQNEIDDAKTEISNAEKELKKARADLDQGYKDYEEGKKKFAEETTNAQNELEAAKKKLIDGQNQIDIGRDTYNTNLNQYNNRINAGQNEINSKEQELNIGHSELEKAQADLNAGYQKLENEFQEPRAELTRKKSQLDDLKIYLEEKQNQLSSLEDDNLNINYEDINQLKAEIESLRNQYEQGLQEYETGKNTLESNYQSEKEKIDQGQREINNKKSELDAGWEELNQGKRELEAQKNEGWSNLSAAKNELDQNQANIDAGWDNYNAGLNKLQSEKINGQKKLKDSYKKLMDGEDEYQKNLDKFKKEKSDALDDINKGEDEIKENKEALLKLVDPEYDVETIFDNEGIDTYYQNSLNMDDLTKVFPTFFYLVAMLVTLTTMKRYIDEQRIINGTLKSLGYSDKQVSQRFYLYGIIPTLIGSIIGSLIGRFLVSRVIINAYSSGFGNLGIDYVNSLPYILLAILLSIGLVALTVYFSSKETVKETPAALLRPKAPEVGKKILLERIKPIWNNLSFMQKITSRNLFRYKSRMFMTLFGVGGCTALTFFGFAMIDSIKDTVDWQQNRINHYDVIAMVDENATDEEFKNYKQKINDYDSLSISFEEANINNKANKLNVNLVIPEDYKKIDDFVSLKSLDRRPIDLSNEKAVITEKASDKLGIKKGDKIKFSYHGKDFELPVTNIAENYTGHYIYISKENFENISGQNPEFNADYLRGDSSHIIKNIENEKAVSAIINSSVIYASMDVLLANLNLVIGIITIISGLLALVVLYNLININVSERKRELATIKVLGFYPREVTSYIFREIFILTILGIFVGFGLGYAMFRYILYVVAPSDILLSYRVHLNPFLYSGLITIAISILLLFIVHKRLKKIDMAEAMSSGE